jgi:hypothetical protein
MSARVEAWLRRVAHLVTRFFASLRPRPLDAAAIAWVAGALEPGELRVWDGMGRADRAESVAVGRRLEASLAGTRDAEDPRWLAAALVHDVGKQVSDYGSIGRAIVTAGAAVLGRARVRSWASAEPSGARASARSRMGSYVAHDELGATLLQRAGARPEGVAWAGAHHRPDRWAATGIPPAVCRALAAADGEAVTTPQP